MKYIFQYFQLKEGALLGACMKRSLEYFDLIIFDETKTIGSLMNNLTKNNVKYTIAKFTETIFENETGLLFFEGKNVSHISPFKKGIYIDAFDHFKKLLPSYVFIFG